MVCLLRLDTYIQERQTAPRHPEIHPEHPVIIAYLGYCLCVADKKEKIKASTELIIAPNWQRK